MKKTTTKEEPVKKEITLLEEITALKTKAVEGKNYAAAAYLREAEKEMKGEKSSSLAASIWTYEGKYELPGGWKTTKLEPEEDKKFDGFNFTDKEALGLLTKIVEVALPTSLARESSGKLITKILNKYL